MAPDATVTIAEAAPLPAGDVLAQVDLLAPSALRDGAGTQWLTEATALVGSPWLYRLDPAELPPPLRARAASGGVEYIGALFRYDLSAAPAGRRYRGVTFTVAISTPGTVAVSLNASDDALDVLVGPGAPVVQLPMPTRWLSAAGSRPGHRGLTLSGGRLGAELDGLFRGTFSWTFSATRRQPLPRFFAMHAVLEAPAGLSTVDGTVGLAVRSARPMAGGLHYIDAETRTLVGFSEPVAAAVAGTGGGGNGADAGRAVRLFIATDVRDYSRRGADAHRAAQRRLVDAVEQAAAAVGARPDDMQKGGDSVLVVFPPGLDEIAAVPRFYAALRGALRAVNAELADAHRVRLRVGMDHGHSGRAAAGWDGQPAIAASRLRDSAPARQALTSDPGLDFVLIVSAPFYEDVIRELAGPPGPDTFVRVPVRVKTYESQAWLHVPRD
jgi:hypothetical protein